jgi:selenide, water dikinase
VAPLAGILGPDPRVLVGTATGDDAGVFRHRGGALVATADFITPVCDDPRRYGRVAAANSVSDVFAMGGRVLFALNLCCFPEAEEHRAVFSEILVGAAEVLRECGGALLGGHTVRDADLKFGLAVVGEADPERLLTNAGARPGDRLVLTKPLGTGVLINAFKLGKIGESELEPALVEMERLNAQASELALAHGARGATDVTGFALVGHALGMAKASGVGIAIDFSRLPVHEGFFALVKKGISTGCTDHNELAARPWFVDHAKLTATEREILFDPQTSGGLLVAVAAEVAPALVQDLVATGHLAADIGAVLSGPPRIEVLRAS